MKRVLLAEDNPMNRELIHDMLEARGFEVIATGDGEEVLRKIEEVQPDVVLLDIQMPRLDGYAVLRRLREGARFRHLPVIALTAYAMHGDREKALESGFDSYISKPIDFAQLRAEIERLLH
jgi:two-component system cell cycle response regulator DivK